MAARLVLLLGIALAFIGFLQADAAVVERTFHVGNLTVSPLCQSRVIPAVNGRLPGPTLNVHEGDTVVVHVINDSPYNITIHWHGIFEILSAWADGPDMITQCPIQPGKRYTQKFTITGQEGTLWWHSHNSVFRETVYGALIIRPRRGRAYPFPKPDKEVPILIGEWWNANIVDVANEAYVTGNGLGASDAFTINGKPGDLYPCSKEGTYEMEVEKGKTYLLRIINAAIDNEHFFKIAGHRFTVVAVDASYTNPYETDLIVIAPGQTVDALMVADATPASYYMAALPYISTVSLQQPFDNTTTTGIVRYKYAWASSQPVMPTMPSLFDTDAAFTFYSNLTGLRRPGDRTVPLHIDERMFVTVGLGWTACAPDQVLCNHTTGSLAASMNNASFQSPTIMSLLQADYYGVEGVYTADFPDNPPVFFDFTNASVNADPTLTFTSKSTKVKKLKYNTTVEMVLQDTAIVSIENHPMHIHSFNFFVVAQGFGNYDPATAEKSYNLVDPQQRNTIAVPTGGWAVIRFTANNPGMWLMHCHFDSHLLLGLATVFEVDNGPTPESTLPPPPPDYPAC